MKGNSILDFRFWILDLVDFGISILDFKLKFTLPDVYALLNENNLSLEFSPTTAE